MSYPHAGIGGTARTSMNPIFVLMPPGREQQARSREYAYSPPPIPPIAPPPPAMLSELAAEFIDRKSKLCKPRTIKEYRLAIWNLYFCLRDLLNLREDLRADELPPDLPKRFIVWGMHRKRRRARQKLPAGFSPAAVQSVLGWFWHEKIEGACSENTASRDWRQLAPFVDFVAERTERPFVPVSAELLPSYEPPTPIVPSETTITGWLRDELTATTRPATAKRWPTREERRRVVLMQGLYYLTGMRTEEGLTALREDLEGHWLLIRPGKTNEPRIIYLSGQALAIVNALHPPQVMLYETRTLLNWEYTQETFDEWIRSSTSREMYSAGEKRQQSMRAALSTFLRPKDRDAEVAQLGHGEEKDVVFRSYLDRLEALPPLLCDRRLPELGVSWFHWPEAIQASIARPLRLIRQQDQITNDLRRARRAGRASLE